MSQGRKNAEYEYCFYCSVAIVARKHDQLGDHFPIPKRFGGKETVPCCEPCHDMKDRLNLDTWPVEWVSKIIQDFPQMSRETKIFIGKMFFVLTDQIRQRKGSDGRIVQSNTADARAQEMLDCYERWARDPQGTKTLLKEIFARIIDDSIEQEREACAKIAFEQAKFLDQQYEGAGNSSMKIGQKIRARGEEKQVCMLGGPHTPHAGCARGYES